MKSILLLNGPNLDMLGVREPAVYGSESLASLECMVGEYGASRGVEVTCFQSNSEGVLIDKIHDAHHSFDGIVYNPGAHTHYSYALRDAIEGIETPCVEVHISDVDSREAFRRVSVIAPACVAQVKGRGFQGYCDAIDLLIEGASEPLGEGYEHRCPAGQVVVGVLDAGEGGMRAAEELEEGQSALGQAGSSARRLGLLRDACAADGMRTFFVRDTSNIQWLTAFDGVFDDERAHALLVTPHDAVLHTDSRYSQAARMAAQAEGEVDVDDGRASHGQFVVSLFSARHGLAGDGEASSPSPIVLGIEDSISLSEYRGLEAAIDESSPGASSDGDSLAETHEPPRPQKNAFPGLQLRETSGLVVGLRAVKEPSEIARMKAAQAITDAAFSHVIEFMRPGMTEREVQIELEDFMRRHGAESLAFSSIVATGANGASPHAIPGETRLEAGHCVVMDFGARAQGYCSDMTRTVFVGAPEARIAEAYEVLRQANERVEAALRPGVTGAEMHELAERVLEEGGFGGRMGHGLGHGVGIDIHEQPNLSPRNDRPLVAGNVVTVEPGIYLPGEFGMRLEDFGVVTEDGFEVFSQSTHDMVVI